MKSVLVNGWCKKKDSSTITITGYIRDSLVGTPYYDLEKIGNVNFMPQYSLLLVSILAKLFLE